MRSLGEDVLAGVSIVFPVLMLMQMMANGEIGSGLASARALGAGRKEGGSPILSMAWYSGYNRADHWWFCIV